MFPDAMKKEVRGQRGGRGLIGLRLSPTEKGEETLRPSFAVTIIIWDRICGQKKKFR